MRTDDATRFHQPLRKRVEMLGCRRTAVGLLARCFTSFSGVPAKGGTHSSASETVEKWIPAFAGMPDAWM